MDEYLGGITLTHCGKVRVRGAVFPCAVDDVRGRALLAVFSTLCMRDEFRRYYLDPYKFCMSFSEFKYFLVFSDSATFKHLLAEYRKCMGLRRLRIRCCEKNGEKTLSYSQYDKFGDIVLTHWDYYVGDIVSYEIDVMKILKNKGFLVFMEGSVRVAELYVH